MSGEIEPKRGGKAARNERRKALAATLNAISVTAVAALIFQPIATNRPPSAGLVLFAVALFVALQGLTHYVLNHLED